MSQPKKEDARSMKVSAFSLVFNKLGIYVIVALLVVIGAIVSAGKFFTPDNVRSILEAVSLYGMVSAGLIYVVYSGNMNDMSIPLTMAMAGMLTVQCINLGFVPALLIGICSGALIGLVNGIMIGKFRANPIIWTWGFNLFLSGVIRVHAGDLRQIRGFAAGVCRRMLPDFHYLSPYTHFFSCILA